MRDHCPVVDCDFGNDSDSESEIYTPDLALLLIGDHFTMGPLDNHPLPLVIF